jgi:cytochrome P450
VMKKELNGQNLIFAHDGQRHRQVRQLLRPAYSREMLDRNLPHIGEAIESLIRKAPVGQCTPLRLLIQRLIAEQLSPRHPRPHSGTDIWRPGVLQTNLTEAFLGNLAPLRVRRPRYAKAKAALFEFARQIPDEHRHMAAPQSERTIVDIVLAGRIGSEPLSENDLTAFTLGPIVWYRYAASTCAFLICELLRHPDVLEQIIAEVDETFGHGMPSAHELRSMRTLSGAFLEALRLHPIAPGIVRHAANGHLGANLLRRLPADGAAVRVLLRPDNPVGRSTLSVATLHNRNFWDTFSEGGRHHAMQNRYRPCAGMTGSRDR